MKPTTLQEDLTWAFKQLPYRIKFYGRAAFHTTAPDRTCPFCSSPTSKLIAHKHVVLELFECQQCGLRFRVPKETPDEAEQFYQADYTYGFTTDCPDTATLAHLIATGFHDSEKDFSVYLDVLRAANVQPGQSLFDFGASWGYGSWQFAHAGYRVYAYEVSQPRARYAGEKLGCTMLATATGVPEKVDCFFSAHVIEHLPDPSLLWQTALEVLKPGGTLVLFMPNGDSDYQRENPGHYAQLWGRVHPLLLSHRALDSMAARYGFQGQAYSSSVSQNGHYDLSQIRAGQTTRLQGDELLYVAHLAAA